MRVGLCGEARPRGGRSGSKKSRLVALNGSTASSLGVGARATGAGERGECFYDLWEIFPGHCGRCPNPHVDRSHGPDKSGSLFLLRTVIPTIASQDQMWMVFR